MTSDNFKIISFNNKGDIKIWNFITGELIKTIYNNNQINSMILTSDNFKIISSTYKEIKIWNLEKVELIKTLTKILNNNNKFEWYNQKILLINK